jgi:flagellar hook-basal body complex protein FliE
MQTGAITAPGLHGVGGVARPLPTVQPDTSFGTIFERLLGDVNSQQLASNQAINDLALGKTDDLHNVMLTVAKADISFRMCLEIRNRLIDAYQEIMRMQV